MSSFTPPILDDIRKLGRDDVVANLPIHATLLPNSPLRVMSDEAAGLAFLVLLYLQQVADNLLPDQANIDWLLRWANIYLNEGPKPATFSALTATATGVAGTFVPTGTIYQSANSGGAIQFETTVDTTIGTMPTATSIRALTAGSVGNLDAGTLLSIVSGIQGADPSIAVTGVTTPGVDAETTEELRLRVLQRIQKPPMGGDADDYVAWALEVPGVTRAWCSPNEMGIGTVTIRFMMDDLRSTTDPTTNGFPTTDDCETVHAHVDAKRPVTVKEFWVVAPTPEPINYTVALSPDSTSLEAASVVSVTAMLRAKAAPAYAVNGLSQGAQTIYAAWVSDAILNTPGIDHLQLTMADHVMPTKGSLAVMGTPTYVAATD